MSPTQSSLEDYGLLTDFIAFLVWFWSACATDPIKMQTIFIAKPLNYLITTNVSLITWEPGICPGCLVPSAAPAILTWVMAREDAHGGVVGKGGPRDAMVQKYMMAILNSKIGGKLDWVSLWITDPPQCNSTNRQNGPNFWRNNAIPHFNLCNIVSLCFSSNCLGVAVLLSQWRKRAT